MKIEPYKNTTEMVADMNSREYATNPNFRAYVESRMAAGDVHHGGWETGNSGTVTFGKGGSNIGGFSVKIGSDHRESGGASRALIDDTATYGGEGFHSAADIVAAISNPEYARNPTYRAAVAWGIAQMTEKDELKF